MSTKRPTRAKQPTRAERLARWLNMGTCGMQDQRDAAAELLRLHAIVAAHEAEKARIEPVAARYDFDGYGYRYIDNGHGSDWQTRIPDAEMLYTKSDEAEIRADERERCARLCDQADKSTHPADLADLIRKGGSMSTEQLAKALRDIADHRMSMYGNDDFFHLKKIARRALAAHEAEKAQADEPLGWMIEGSECVWRGEFAESDAKGAARIVGGTCRAFPIYRAAPAAPVAVPLTDEELRDALRQCPHDAVENLRVRWLYATDFARVIERTCAARWGTKLEGGQG